MGTKWTSWILKKKCKKQYMCRMVIILCQWDFSEQIEKLVRLLLYTSEDCSRKFHPWVHFVRSSKRRVKNDKDLYLHSAAVCCHRVHRDSLQNDSPILPLPVVQRLKIQNSSCKMAAVQIVSGSKCGSLSSERCGIE